jgi:hypothetical protein
MVKLIMQKENRNKSKMKFLKTHNNNNNKTFKNTRFMNSRISVFYLSSGVIPLASSPGIGV